MKTLVLTSIFTLLATSAFAGNGGMLNKDIRDDDRIKDGIEYSTLTERERDVYRYRADGDDTTAAERRVNRADDRAYHKKNKHYKNN
ncbi:MAG: hypothetical protein SFT92_03620 [Rickettsiales bacterium]|nr:hypothetical protein [Rickettsiales bacterium]